MRRMIAALAVATAATALVGSAPTAAAGVSSQGCDVANFSYFDAGYPIGTTDDQAQPGSQAFLKGERITILSNSTSTTSPPGLALEVNGVVVATSGFPGRLTYEFPADANYTVSWYVTPTLTSAPWWEVSCTPVRFENYRWQALSNIDSAVTAMRLSLDRFVVEADSVWHDSRLNWSTDYCSGPAAGNVVWVGKFLDACRRHDFGYRNFGGTMRLDPTPARKAFVDEVFLNDLMQICDRQNILRADCVGRGRWCSTAPCATGVIAPSSAVESERRT